MFKSLRPALPPKRNTASQNPIIYSDGVTTQQFHSPSTRSERFFMTHILPPTDPKTGPPISQPPPHYHMFQSEQFKVLSGVGSWYVGTDSKPAVTLQASSDYQPMTYVAPRRYHRFENASKTENLVVDIQLDEEAFDNEERFFRNLFGYLDDCKKAGTEPSLFQLVVFLRSADTPLALPVPNETLGLILSWIFMQIIAMWGIWILGYEESYPEYYDSNKSKRE